MIIRPYQPGDADALAQIFFDAVRIGAAPKYTEAELRAWAPVRPAAKVWAARLEGLTTFVAEADAVLGFMSLRNDGYLDLAFVAPDQRGKGVAAGLHAAVLDHARSLGVAQMTTEASRMARPFFLRMGWQEITAQTILRHGQSIENFRMRRDTAR
jgi:putative acetyltransferase